MMPFPSSSPPCRMKYEMLEICYCRQKGSGGKQLHHSKVSSKKSAFPFFVSTEIFVVIAFTSEHSSTISIRKTRKETKQLKNNRFFLSEAQKNTGELIAFVFPIVLTTIFSKKHPKQTRKVFSPLVVRLLLKRVLLFYLTFFFFFGDFEI